MIVIGESKIEEQLEKAMKRASKLIEKQIDADAKELGARSTRRPRRLPASRGPEHDVPPRNDVNAAG